MLAISQLRPGRCTGGSAYTFALVCVFVSYGWKLLNVNIRYKNPKGEKGYEINNVTHINEHSIHHVTEVSVTTASCQRCSGLGSSF